jgi:hypothetical protein
MQPTGKRSRADEELEPSFEREQVHENPMLYCPVCDQRLISLKCKLLCERCGYFMSCADYY